ncbi:dihydroorotase [Notoacmeibacter sp. MSK16QG-6]|uniref:dihydroorotase n=1 Tax=Notoacmeibacter sp. MSK16QG-6 TaxID=2957982 RepID=UPI00209EDAA5|nr:dihydroorotase [Notoacmeibacter sp. MSK16QG-6]MCP1197885.1 dihydroorotase [Notoacmeibacter sp. MSK16QG-6]
MSTLLLANGRVVDPSRGIDATGAVLVEDDHIVAAGPDVHNQGAPEGAEIIDCKGRIIAPGLVDGRVFIGEPGYEYRETIRSASEAAAAGGVTSLVMMPDTSPVMDEPSLVEYVLRTARATSLVRIHPAAAITRGLRGQEMTEFGLLREAGAVAFTDGRNTLESPVVMRRAMTYARDFDAVIASETQDEALAAGGVMNEGKLATLMGLPGVPREAELISLQRDLALAGLTGARYHAAKISCMMSADAVRRAKDNGHKVTAGVSINHLSLNENDVQGYRTFYRLSPPLRDELDRHAMANAIADGTIDVVVSSHDPQDVDTKRLPFAEAAPGAIGLETLLAALLRRVHDGTLNLMRAIEVVTSAPAALFGLPYGTLKPGSKADIAIIDLDAPWEVSDKDLRSHSRNSCFENARMSGRVIRTIVSGRTVFELND